MIRTQIQIPEPLYREVKRVARQQGWSVSEVIRRGAEAVARSYPATKAKPTAGLVWPPAIQSALRVTDPAELRERIAVDQESVQGA